MFRIHIEQETRPHAGIDLWMYSWIHYWNEIDKINVDFIHFLYIRALWNLQVHKFQINRKKEC